MSNEGYEDPSSTNPQFPNRPTHEDFQRLSNTAQGMDLRAQTAEIPEIIGLDMESVLYFIQNRLGVLGNAVGQDLMHPLLMSVYLDGLTLGTLAERAKRDS